MRNKSLKSDTGKISLFIVLLLICCILSLTGFATMIPAKATEAVVENSGLNDKYTIGEDVTIPEGEVKIGNETFSVQPIIFYPDGRVNQEEKITLDEMGIYRLEYVVEKDSEIYIAKKSFTVSDYIVTYSSNHTPAKYVENARYERKGLAYELNSGDTLVYNKIVNIKNLTKDKPFIQFTATPLQELVPEAKDFFIKLTDVHNKENAITIRYRRAPKMENQDGAYIAATHGNEKFRGYVGDECWIDNYSYGTYFKNGMRGNKNSEDPQFYFDYKTSTLYVSKAGQPEVRRKVVNFVEDFKLNPWQGFTTGDVQVTVYNGTYDTKDTPFHGMITKLFDEKLDEGLSAEGNCKLVEVSTTGSPVVNLNQYDKDDLPRAMVGYKYKIFDAEIKPVYGMEKLSTHVYYSYNSSLCYELPVTDNSFTPIEKGVHSIVYTSTDRFGNKSDSILNVYAELKGEETFDLSVEGYENYKDQGITGVYYNIADKNSVITNGNNGVADINIKAENKEKGVVIDNIDSSFLPQVSGEWTITYTATDYLERTGSFSYKINVVNSDKVIFQEVKAFPHYLVVNAKNPVPAVKVIDYDKGMEVKNVDKIELKRDGLLIEQADGENVVTPKVPGNYQVVYTSTSSRGVTAEKIYNVRAVDVGFGKKSFDLSRYFVSDGIMSRRATNKNISFNVKENSVVDYMLPVDGINFLYSFNLSDTINVSNEIIVSIQDIGNENQKVDFHITKDHNGKVFLGVNDGEPTELKKFAYGGGANFDMSFSASDKQIVIGSAKANVSTYVNGDPFTGFDSLKVYMSMKVVVPDGVSGETEIFINSLSGQPFSKIHEDIIEPRVVLSEKTMGKYNLGETIHIYRATVLDVLDPYVKATLKVTNKKNVCIKDINGFELNNVEVDKDYEIKADVTGSFKILYCYVDSTGNGYPRGRGAAFEVVSRKEPIITINEHTESASVGKAVEIAGVSIDSISEEYSLSIFYQGPTGRMKQLPKYKSGEKEGQYNYDFVPSEKGVYTIRYYVKDAWDNITIAEYKLNVA